MTPAVDTSSAPPVAPVAAPAPSAPAPSTPAPDPVASAPVAGPSVAPPIAPHRAAGCRANSAPAAGGAAAQDAAVRTTAAAARRKRRTAAALLVLAACAIAASSRLANIGADPPAWMAPDYLADEAWWADSARGKVFFDDYFADDFGTAYLATPLHTWILEAVFRVFGPGTVQVRVVAAAASVAAIALLGIWMLRRFGALAAVTAAAMLALSPMAWSYARVGLIEWSQALAIAVAFCLWVSPRAGQSLMRPLAAGLAMAAAVWLKPTALVVGVIPVVLAGATASAVRRRATPAVDVAHRGARSFTVAALGFVIGSAAVVAALGGHASELLDLWLSESHLDERASVQYLTLPGAALLSAERQGDLTVPRLWQVAARAPALSLALWGYLLWLYDPGRRRHDEPRPARRAAGARWRLLPLEAAALVWLTATAVLISLSLQQPVRRFVVLLPPMALCAGVFLARYRRSPIHVRSLAEQTVPLHRSYVTWLLLLLPPLVLLKAPVSAAIMDRFADVPLGQQPGLSHAAAGTLFMAGWLGTIVALAPLRRLVAVLRHVAARAAPLLVVLAVALLELPMVVAGLAGGRSTLLEQQNQLAAVAERSQHVLGHFATSLFMPYPVRTVRRTTPADHSPPPNPDIWQRTRPEHIVQLTRYNFHPHPRRYQDLLAAYDYRSVRQIHVGPRRDGRSRFVFELYALGAAHLPPTAAGGASLPAGSTGQPSGVWRPAVVSAVLPPAVLVRAAAARGSTTPVAGPLAADTLGASASRYEAPWQREGRHP